MPYKNKEDEKQNSLKYREQHKEAINQYNKQYREQHKEAINQCQLKVQACECCNITIRRRHFAEHTRSKRHIANSNNDLNSAVS